MLRRILLALGLPCLLAATGGGCADPPDEVESETAAFSELRTCNPAEGVVDPNELVKSSGRKTPLKSQFVELVATDGSKSCIHYVEAGRPEDPTLVLIHGVPQFWYAWRKQIDPLVNAGFHVVVPDLRGFNESARPDPKDVKNYSLTRTSQDIDLLIQKLGKKKATVIGHDIGGLVAWGLGMYHPEHLERLMVLDGPHPALWRKFLLEKRDRPQFADSWYVFAWSGFPKTADAYARGDIFGFGGGHFEQIKDAMVRQESTAARAGAVTDEEIRVYADSAKRHGNTFLQMEAYYGALFEKGAELETSQSLFLLTSGAFRAFKGLTLLRGPTLEEIIAGRERVPTPNFPKVTVPTRVIQGEKDGYLNAKVMADPKELSALASQVSVRVVADASHWILEENSEVVTAEIVAFARGTAPPQ